MDSQIGQRIAACLLSLLLTGIGIWLGVKASRKERKVAARTAALSGLIAVVSLLAWEAWLTPYLARVPGATFFEFALTGGALPCALISASALLPPLTLRRPMLLLAGLASMYAILAAAGPLQLLLPVWQFTDESTGGLGLQDYWWSCGPTSVSHAVREAGGEMTVHEAALLCDVRPWRGTSNVGLAASLEHAGYRATVKHFANWEQLAGRQPPCLAITVIFGGVLHVVSILEVSEDSIDIYDPIIGETTLSREEFEEQWIGTIIDGQQPTPP